MELLAIIIVAWCVGSVPLGILVGRMIAHRRDPERRSVPEQRRAARGGEREG